MLIRIGYCITFIMLLSVAGCDWLSSKQDDSKTQRSQPPAADASWITHVSGRIFGEYGCDSFVTIKSDDLKEQHLFPGALMQRYSVEAVYISTWTNLADTVSGPLTVYCALFSGDLYAYGLYSSIPGGIDQTIMRGGPSKRLGRTFVAVKNRWVIWTVPAHKDSHPLISDYELVLTGICTAIPGKNWSLPEDIRVLGAMKPAPESIQFQPENYMGLSFLNSAICARYRTKTGPVELFGILPHTRSAGQRQILAFKRWIADQGITAVFIETDELVSLSIDDTSMEPVYMMVDSYGLRGVKGINSISDAQALLARWIP
jgi:hypothetical protein